MNFICCFIFEVDLPKLHHDVESQHRVTGVVSVEKLVWVAIGVLWTVASIGWLKVATYDTVPTNMS